MANLPNVSAIYRDLAFMTDGPTRHQEPSCSVPLYSQPDQQYGSKQARHNQLMEKLRNAQQECSSFNYEIAGTRPKPDPPFQQRYHQTQTHIRNPYQQTEYKNTGWKGSQQTTWQPPPMRYRHIEDLKPNKEQQVVQQMIQRAEKAALEKEFYEDQRLKEQQKHQPKLPSERAEVEELPPATKFDGVSETSYGRTWVNRQSKFEDKIESYYELCKRRPVSSKIDQSGHSGGLANKNKYTRTPNRPNVMELDQAIKMLSYD